MPEIVLEPTAVTDAFFLESVDSLDSIREEWMELASACDNVFWTWEWQSLWWRHFGKGRALMTSAVRGGDGRLIAILPLYVAKESPLRVVRFIGHGHGDSLGVICRPSESKIAAHALRDMMRKHGFDLLLGDHVAANAGWASDLGAKVLRHNGYPLVRYSGGSWDQYLAAQGPRFGKRLRRNERQLAARYTVGSRTCADPSRLTADLDIVFRLHEMRFGKHEDCWFCGPNEAFQREFAALALERGWLRMLILELDGRPAGALYHFRFNGIEFGYQGGRDPSWNDVSVGSVLETQAIQRGLEDGLTEYRFLEGDEEYKYRFATHDPGLETILAAGSIVGRVALAAATRLGRQPIVAALGKRLAG